MVAVRSCHRGSRSPRRGDMTGKEEGDRLARARARKVLVLVSG